MTDPDHRSRERQSSRDATAAELLGESTVMRTLRAQIANVAGRDVTVLIVGDTGTGKHAVARAIHEQSRRKDGPFVAVRCAGLAPMHAASAFFGHRRGAFSSAVDDRVGLFEAADQGTLLLGGIGDMPLGTQGQLLRVLEERTIRRLGETQTRSVDVRLLITAPRDLEARVAAGQFRNDLFYRVRIARLPVPRLEQHAEDIPLLARTFLEQARGAHGLSVDAMSHQALQHLRTRSWPANVRELKATIEAAALRATGTVAELQDLTYGSQGERE